MAATDHGPLPFAEKYVPNPKRDQHVVSAAHHYQNLRRADERVKTWGYFGLFYANSDKSGARAAFA